MNRRTFLRTAAGLVVAAGAGEVWTPEPDAARQLANAYDAEVRRHYFLDRTMLGPTLTDPGVGMWNAGIGDFRKYVEIGGAWVPFERLRFKQATWGGPLLMEIDGGGYFQVPSVPWVVKVPNVPSANDPVTRSPILL